MRKSLNTLTATVLGTAMIVTPSGCNRAPQEEAAATIDDQREKSNSKTREVMGVLLDTEQALIDQTKKREEEQELIRTREHLSDDAFANAMEEIRVKYSRIAKVPVGELSSLVLVISNSTRTQRRYKIVLKMHHGKAEFPIEKNPDSTGSNFELQKIFSSEAKRISMSFRFTVNEQGTETVIATVVPLDKDGNELSDKKTSATCWFTGVREESR